MSGTISVHLGDHGVQNVLSRLEVGIVWHGHFAASWRSWRSENVFSRPEIGNGTISLHLGDHGVQNVLSRLEVGIASHDILAPSSFEAIKPLALRDAAVHLARADGRLAHRR